MSLFARIAASLIAISDRRPPSYVIGSTDNPYLRRWWLIPRNPWFNIYLHQFLRDDDDRALHDHPWVWCSIILRGRYIEHTIHAGGIHRHVEYQTGTVRVNRPTFAHRLALHPGESAWTLFITGPRVREWGFHCPSAGWVHWQAFTSSDGREVGKGCDQ